MNTYIYKDSYIKTSNPVVNDLNNNIRITQPAFLAKSENDKYVKSESDNTDKKKKIAAWSIGGISIGGLASWFISNFRKPPKTKTIEPVVDTAAEILKELIQKVKPENVEIASAIYPSLLKNSETLKIKPDDFEKILTGINKNNKEFIASEGIELISSKMENLKDIITSPVDDVLELISNLTAKNKSIFSIISENPEFYKIEEPEDISIYLKTLNPDKNDYMFNELMPILHKYEEPLRISLAENYANLLRTVTKDTQDVIPDIAQTAFEKQKGRKFKILTTLTPDNKNCAVPLLRNAEQLQLDVNSIAKLLSGLKNEQISSIDAVANNIKNVKQVGLNPEDLFRILKTENDTKIFNMLIKDPETYLIETPEDIEFYLKSVDVKNLKFIENKLVPKLLEHKDKIIIPTSDFFADLMHHITPKTIGSIDIVLPYISKYEDTINIINLLCGVTEKNIKNLPEFLQKLPKLKADAEKTTGYWDANLTPQEVTEMIDKIGNL